jgi:hypothetical protein
MLLTDVNILVCAFREDAEDHARHRTGLMALSTAKKRMVSPIW